MKMNWKDNKREKDIFQNILSDPRLYECVESFNKVMESYESKPEKNYSGHDDELKKRLAIIWIKLVRGLLDTEQARKELERIGKATKIDKLTKIEYELVLAQYALLIENEYMDAKCRLEELAEILENSAHTFLYALVARALCSVNVMIGDINRAEMYAQDTMSIFRRSGNEWLLASSINTYAVLKKMTGHYDEAERFLKRAIQIFGDIGAKDGEFLSLNNLAIVKMKKGEWGKAETCYSKLEEIKQKLDIKCENLLIYKVNIGHLQLLQRDFIIAEKQFLEMVDEGTRPRSRKHQALAHEFLGELYTEKREYKRAQKALEDAEEIARQIAPKSDLMAEIKRRQAYLYLKMGARSNAEEKARECIWLSRHNNELLEMGAALRILGQVFRANEMPRKAEGAYTASIRILRGIYERYELMRTLMEYGDFLIRSQGRDGRKYVLEAKQLSEALGLDYFTSRSHLLLGSWAVRSEQFTDAWNYLGSAESTSEHIRDCDMKDINRELRHFRQELEQASLVSSMSSAKKLKALGKIFEDARFPLEELTPELAFQIAYHAGAESLFLVQRKNGGYRIPLKYNISSEDAKHMVRRLENGTKKKLFDGTPPKIHTVFPGRRMLSIPSKRRDEYMLCTVMSKEKTLEKDELEFLFAITEVMERLADERQSTSSTKATNAFIGGNWRPLRPDGSFKAIVTMDPAVIALTHLAERAGKTQVPVLLEGDTGVGKELFARAIHESSPRSDRPFIAINTGGIPVNFLESELFGYVKGAYTDAKIDKTGLVEEARGGTLFLDEVGEMSEELQVKLLRLLENGEYRRLGENTVRYADVRVISATNKDLAVLIAKGQFREDLYYRLTTVKFKIPPLRERKDDIRLLVNHFLNESMIKTGANRRILHIHAKALQALELYHWPGNIRELQNEIMRLVSLMGDEEEIRFNMLSDTIKDFFKNRRAKGNLECDVENYERRLILNALDENNWNRIRTAKKIGLPRTTLLAKMKRLKITS